MNGSLKCKNQSLFIGFKRYQVCTLKHFVNVLGTLRPSVDGSIKFYRKSANIYIYIYIYIYECEFVQ